MHVSLNVVVKAGATAIPTEWLKSLPVFMLWLRASTPVDELKGVLLVMLVSTAWLDCEKLRTGTNTKNKSLFMMASVKRAVNPQVI